MSYILLKKRVWGEGLTNHKSPKRPQLCARGQRGKVLSSSVSKDTRLGFSRVSGEQAARAKSFSWKYHKASRSLDFRAQLMRTRAQETLSKGHGAEAFLTA